MMIKRLIALSLLLPTVGFSAFYIEGNFGQSTVDEVGVNATTDTDTGKGINGNVGYMLNQHLGLELGYTQYANADLSNGSTEGSDERTAFHLAARLVCPFDNQVQIFTKLGIGRVNSTLSEALTRENNEDNELTNTNLYYGVGLGYTINPDFMLNMQYNTIKGSDTVGNSNFMSFGATLFIN